VFGLVLPLLGGAVVLVVDDTLARKRGLRVWGAGMHHDPLLSSRGKAVTNWGHDWVVLGVALRLPFCPDRYFCLPVLFRLYVSKQTAAKHPGRHRGMHHSRPELAVQMLRLVCNRFPGRRFHLVCDSTYGGRSVLLELPANCDLTSRLPLDARLHAKAVNRKSSKGTKGGRPRKRGKRLARPERMLEGRCRRVALDVYGRKDRSRVAECLAYWYCAPDKPLRVVAVDPLTGGRKRQAFYSTLHDATPEQVLAWYAMRWSVEVAFHDAKGHLGFEQPQGWTKRAAQRTAPVAMLLYSLVVLWFDREGHRHWHAPDLPWYAGKARASFADMLATLRCRSVEQEVSSMGLHGRGSRNVVKALLHAVKQAA
jgi:hypothetical protein